MGLGRRRGMCYVRLLSRVGATSRPCPGDSGWLLRSGAVSVVPPSLVGPDCLPRLPSSMARGIGRLWGFHHSDAHLCDPVAPDRERGSGGGDQEAHPDAYRTMLVVVGLVGQF